jgi:outer membrane protein TolC
MRESSSPVERVRVAESLEATLDESVQTSRQLYNIGMADRPDLLEVEAESARGRSAHAPHAPTGKPRGPRSPRRWAIRRFRVESWRGPSPTCRNWPIRATAWKTTQQENPQLVEAALQADVADASIAVERGVTSPDLLLRGGAMYDRARETAARRPTAGRQGEVGMTLPLWNRNHAGIAAAQARSEAARHALGPCRSICSARFDET